MRPLATRAAIGQSTALAEPYGRSTATVASTTHGTFAPCAISGNLPRLEVIQTPNGIARNEPAIRDFLRDCPTVTDVAESSDILMFKFAATPSEVPPGVYFDLTEAPF